MQKIPEMSISINVNENDKFSRNISDDLLISTENLDECLEKQAALYAYYCMKHQQLCSMKDRLDFEYDKIYNQAMQIARRSLMESGSRVTDKQIHSVVSCDENVLAAKEKYLDISAKKDQLYALVKALEQKKDMIYSIVTRRKYEIDAIRGSSIFLSKIPKSGIEDE
jgi:hypothetical protein